MYSHWADSMAVPEAEALGRAQAAASRLAAEDLSSSVRRTLVKEVCTMLMNIYDDGWAFVATGQETEV
ncbi:hypothetical protein [Paenibacillus sp. tmac-D7]|nr:hypothetical protein [Paenibacillus sp. tmac-D7]